MGSRGWLLAGLLAGPALAQAPPPPPAPPLDPEFLEFLAATAEVEDERFMDFMESPEAERELRRAGTTRKVAKDGKHED